AANGLNGLADRGEFAAITRRINGGLNGHAERLALWERAKRVLS
ncbi:glycoside hydrolase family 19 protein, partial [Pseudomonas aeruginosa]|nr:glycoside hydrolase family 19 protein [Pseudomonas aeruginosa]